MSAELTAVIGFLCAAGASLALTPLAIKIANRLDFLDRPRGYRRHVTPTPFLGGAAVLAGFLVAAIAVGRTSGPLLVVLGGAIGMWLLGTLDDSLAVAPKWRLLATAGVAVAVYGSGLGWSTPAEGIVNVALTVLWIVLLVNAFNLMDNLDGACCTVACVASAGIGILALIRGHTTIAVLAFALSGACAAFLPWNLAGPARIFLGDGGSMPVGFLIAVFAMAVARRSQEGNAGLLVGALLVGLPIFDVMLVSASRSRRGVTLMTGGRDHLTHRILLALRSPRRVAAVLAIAEGVLCSLAILGYELGTGTLVGLAFVALATGVVAVFVLDTARWRPPGIAMSSKQISAEPADREMVGVEPSWTTSPH